MRRRLESGPGGLQRWAPNMSDSCRNSRTRSAWRDSHPMKNGAFHGAPDKQHFANFMQTHQPARHRTGRLHGIRGASGREPPQRFPAHQ